MPKLNIISPNLSARSTHRIKPSPVKERSLKLLRMKELDREFIRQTKQLTTMTKKFGKKLSDLGSGHK
ncbi:hypothetical protein H7097_00230 [Aeromicrobium sp.]|nr:hypothetical protein [Candidatus Saccharibacteria bacterium]